MIAERIESRRRNGVDGIRPDQLFHIHDVAILWIFCAGAGPEQTLRLRAFGGQSFPSRTAKKFLILAIGELRISDRDFSLQAREQRALVGIGFGLQLGIDLPSDKLVIRLTKKLTTPSTGLKALPLFNRTSEAARKAFA